MPRIAIDVALLPSEEMMDKIIEINQELLISNDKKIILGKDESLPHISLCMGCIEKDDIEEVSKILESITEGFPEFNLLAEDIKADIIPTGKKVSGLHIQNTANLQKLHEMIMRRLRKYLSYDVDTSMLFNPPEVEDVTLYWIKGYAKKHNDTSLFHPHITVGFGETDKFSFPINFESSRLALCQLGNYCTCRKVIADFGLSN